MSETENPELQGLIEKRDQLLAEVKQLKTRLKEVEAERDQLAEAKAGAESDLRRITVDNVVDDLLKDVLLVPTDQARALLAGKFKFERGEDGNIQFLTEAGEPVTYKEGDEEKTAGFDARQIVEALEQAGYSKSILLGSRASGAGGVGSNIRHSTPTRQAAVQKRYGLR